MLLKILATYKEAFFGAQVLKEAGNLRKVFFKINHYAQYISSFTVVFLMFLTVADILRRVLLNRPIVGVYELTGPTLTIMVFLSFGYAELFKDHVVIDFVYDHLPKTAQKVCYFFNSTVYFIIVLLMTWRVFTYGVAMMSSGAETSNLKIPHWPFIMVAGIGMICYILAVIHDFIPEEGGVTKNDIS